MLAAYLGVWTTLVFVWMLAVTTSATFAQTTSTSPITVEFDLVFPRNETYAPDVLLPIVVVIQNPEEVWPLAFSTGWKIYWRGVNASNNYIATSYRRNIWANYSTIGNEPYFETFMTDATPSFLTLRDSCPVRIASFGITNKIKQSTDQNVFRDTCVTLAERPR